MSETAHLADDGIGPAVQQFLEVASGYSAAVRLIVAASRAIWHVCLQEGTDADRDGWKVSEPQPSDARFRRLPVGTLDRQLQGAGVRERARNALAGLLSDRDLFGELTARWQYVDVRGAQPLWLARHALSQLRSDADLQHAVRRTIRRDYGIPLSWRTVRAFNILGNLLRAKCVGKTDSGRRFTLSSGELSDCEEALRQDDVFAHVPTSQTKDVVSCFLETCRYVNFLALGFKPGTVLARGRSFEAEYLISHLFGLPTEIPGFDELFGAGGIILPETRVEGSDDASPGPEADPLSLFEDTLSPRIVVIAGERGTGKSIFAAQLATEVAKRGGVSWIMPLEQTPAECVYNIESMGARSLSSQMLIGTGPMDMAIALKRCSEDQGALLVLRPSDHEPWEKFLATVQKQVKALQWGHLRLIVIDSLNSQVPGANGEQIEPGVLRQKLLDFTRAMKSLGVNVLLVVERDAAQEGIDLVVAEKIADTIIDLSVKKQFGYARRFFEIKKSRMQREQRGRHSFSIVAGSGVRISPSSASVHARVRARRPRTPETPISFGVKGVDDVLGEGALCQGDVVALRGPGGSFKTPLGLAFLLMNDNGKGGLRQGQVSLLFSPRDSEDAIRYYLQPTGMRFNAPGLRQPLSFASLKPDDCLEIVSLPRGHVDPGRILQIIEDEIHRQRDIYRRQIHRVMIDNLGELEANSPAVTDDSTFGVTLVDMLRGFRATALLICGERHGATSHLQEDISRSADCLVQFDRFEFGGARRVVMRVLKTRSGEHRRESYEVSVSKKLIEIMPSSSLLRLRSDTGGVAPVKIRLFLHMETPIQRDYFRTVKGAVQSVLSRETELDRQERLYVSRLMGIGQLSALDELQIVQLDEYQLGLHWTGEAGGVSYIPLREFPSDSWECSRRDEYIPTLLDRRTGGTSAKRRGDGAGVFRAIPFIANVSLLAYRASRLGDEANDVVSDWDKLAQKAWEHERAGADSLFFDFPKATAENYNCLFLEILLSLKNCPDPEDDECPMRLWLRTEEAAEAAAIYYKLCRPAYLASIAESASPRAERDGGSNAGQILPHASTASSLGAAACADADGQFIGCGVQHQAVVWRHWYTTLAQMRKEMAKVSEDLVKDLMVVPLPGRVSIAGEWYLGIPAYSAAPEAGLEMIKLMTIRSAELNRVRLGVGLPTRKAFYERAQTDDTECSEAPQPLLLPREQVYELIQSGFRRSRFACYFDLSRTLEYYLREFLTYSPSERHETWEKEKAALMEISRRVLGNLVREIDFAQGYTAEGANAQKVRELCRLCRSAFARSNPTTTDPGT